MERDVVHDRKRAAARAVGVADGLDEADGRDGVASRAGPVVAAGRDREADHVDVRVDRLQRVVARSERGLVRHGRRDRAVRLEGRRPEAPEVRLVADDEVRHVGEGARDEGRVRRKFLDAAGHAGDVGAVARRDRQQHANIARERPARSRGAARPPAAPSSAPRARSRRTSGSRRGRRAASGRRRLAPPSSCQSAWSSVAPTTNAGGPSAGAFADAEALAASTSETTPRRHRRGKDDKLLLYRSLAGRSI